MSTMGVAVAVEGNKKCVKYPFWRKYPVLYRI